MFNNNSKKIIFEAATDASKYILKKPKPSTNHVPVWYKKQKLYSNNTNDDLKAHYDSAVGTYKMCTPFIDALTAGYMLVTTSDLVVRNIGKEKYDPYIQWPMNWTPLDVQSEATIGNFPVPYNHSNVSFRWHCDWKIITPNGYSLWVTHPSNRFDLPFTTLNAFVDTDKHPSKILFPFFIKNGFEGIIPEGTPVAQIVPIKREKWISKQKDYKDGTRFVQENIMSIFMSRTYKKLFWSKKEYR